MADLTKDFWAAYKEKQRKSDRLKEIADTIEWMSENLHGCDWCCGGGDEKLYQLRDEQDKLNGSRT